MMEWMYGSDEGEPEAKGSPAVVDCQYESYK